MSIGDFGAALDLGLTLDYASVVIGVLTGALFGCRRKSDVIGVIVLGFLTGFGGGIVRDLLLGAQDIYFMTHPDLIWFSLALCVFTFYFRRLVIDHDRSIAIADSFSVALFAVAGCAKAYAFGQDGLYIVILGTITAVGGGAIRDLFAGETPAFFKASNYYAIASVVGCIAFVLAIWASNSPLIASIVCFCVIVALRGLSIYFGWQARLEADVFTHIEEVISRHKKTKQSHK